jgi:valyl-tRNA synthetase
MLMPLASEPTSTSGGVTVMEESWKRATTPQPSTPAEGVGERPEPSSTAEAKETEPFAQAASQITELMQRFVEEVRAARRDAQVAGDSARTAHADAERIRQEAIKLRADAEADAIRVTDDARAEADRIDAEARAGAERTREDAQTKEQEALRAARSILAARQEIDRASRDLGAMKKTVLETFRDISDRIVMALGEVEGVIEKWASSDAVVVVGEADEPAPADVPQVPRPDLLSDPET